MEVVVAVVQDLEADSPIAAIVPPSKLKAVIHPGPTRRSA
jgi:hypothetical protein